MTLSVHAASIMHYMICTVESKLDVVYSPYLNKELFHETVGSFGSFRM